MKYESEIKSLLISNAIDLIAEGGFEKATTKALTFYRDNIPGIKMNEVYIYRLFGGKDELFGTVFGQLDKELFDVFQSVMKSSGCLNGDNTKDKLYEIFLTVWKFILLNENRCRTYVRYYYSFYFKGTSLEKHQRNFDAVVAWFRPLFLEEADAMAIMHTVFITLLDFAIRVYNGMIEDNEVNRPHIFNVLYCMMVTYFKDSLKSEA